MFLKDGKMVMIYYDVGQLAPPLFEEKALLKWGFAFQGKKWVWLVSARSLKVHCIRSKGYSNEMKL
jgi:hypothetical protein